MSEDLRKFLAKYVALTADESTEIISLFRTRKIKKNEYLLKEGEVCNDLVFVQEGCLRLFYMAGETEISVWFAFQHSSAIDICSFISGLPSKNYLQAVEDSVVYYLAKADLQRLYQTQPKMQEMMRSFWEDSILTLIDRFSALQRDSAEQRYLHLLAKPPYLQKIPQKYLASFIGVTPTSLSRIRKKIR